jgi:hypothetical protein
MIGSIIMRPTGYPWKKPHHRVSWSKLSFALTCLLILAALVWPRATSALKSNGIAAAWERARQSGDYYFSADIKQTTVPQSTVRNVGRASTQQTLHLEGETHLPDQQLHLTLWSQGGSVMNASSGVEIKVDGDRAFARQGAGDWQEINNFVSAFAPQGDFMAYLAAAKNVKRDDVKRKLDISRFTFEIDGRSYAQHLRDEMQEQLTAAGELPPGVNLDLPKQYVDRTGDGELWVDADGLPLRQILRLQFPPRPDEQEIHAEVTVDFDFTQTNDARIPHPHPRPLQKTLHRAGPGPHTLFDPLAAAAERPRRGLCRPASDQISRSRGPRARERHAARPQRHPHRV